MQLGVIGLGNIGSAIASNLIADRHEVCVFDSAKSRCEPLVAAGASAAAGPAEVARRSEITLLSLPTPAVVDEVATQWLAGAPPGRLLVDLSTNAPASVRALGARLSAAGCGLVEAPLSGGAIGAKSRGLVFMLGGELGAVERARGVLAKLGRACIHVGPLGHGNVAKLVNSLVAFSTTWASLEALALAAKAGLDLRTTLDVIRTAGAGNFFTNFAVEGINQRGRPTQFALALAAKDASLILDLAREHGVPTPVAAQIGQVLVSAIGAGLGDRDWTDLVELVERQAAIRLELPALREGSAQPRV
jgi:3-hydroxyisobutyrate dehydrogenase-like beta-hydroxyacid dehydrogenase